MSVSPFDVVAECDLIEASCLLLPEAAPVGVVHTL